MGWATTWRHAVALGGLGAATGVVTWVLVEHVADDSDLAGNVAGWVAPGLVYGLALGAWLHVRWRPSWRRLLWLAAGMVASWNLAVRLATELYDRSESLLLSGATAGLCGAAVVAAAAALADPVWRRPRDLATVVGVGTAGGLLLAVGGGGIALYVVWQGAVAAVLGAALDPATRRS